MHSYLQLFTVILFKSLPKVARLRIPAGVVLLLPRLHGWWYVMVLGGATTIAPVRMASISLHLNVSVEGAHAMFTGKMLRIRIVRAAKEYRYGSCRALMDWYEYL